MAQVFASEKGTERFYPKQQFKTSSGVQIEYIFFDRGKKETIHFVDGWALRFSCWKRQMRDKNFKEIFTDKNLLFSNNRGHGNSEIGDSTEQNFLTDCANDRRELLENLRVKKVHLVSHSMGALISAEIYAMEKDFEILSMSFATPVVCNPLKTFTWSRVVQPFLDMTEGNVARERAINGMKILLNSLTNPITARIYYSYFKMANRSDVSFEAFSKFMESILNVDPKVFVLAFGSMLDQGDQIGEKLRLIRCPVLAINGKNDFLISHIALRILKEKIPQARLETLQRSTHFPQAEQPERFNSIIQQFMKTI